VLVVVVVVVVKNVDAINALACSLIAVGLQHAVNCGIIIAHRAACHPRQVHQLNAQSALEHLQALQVFSQVLARSRARKVVKAGENAGDVGGLMHDAAPDGASRVISEQHMCHTYAYVKSSICVTRMHTLKAAYVSHICIR
jgi:hypothetical protein